jgi:ribosome-associated protein
MQVQPSIEIHNLQAHYIPIRKDYLLLMLNPDEISILAVNALDSKKAQDIKLLKVTDITILADFFVICTAGSTTQLKTLSDEVEKALKESGERLLRREGHRSSSWVLLDYGCVIVHIFLQETREFYTLERLWSDAQEIEIADVL